MKAPVPAVSRLAIAAACIIAGTSPAQASENASGQPDVAAAISEESPNAEDGQIVVTGSRIARSTFETPSPVTVVTTDELVKSSPSTLAAALNNLPSLVATTGPNSSANPRTAGRSNLNLRGIGENRTLVLVNGHRFPGSSPALNVDTNLIPQGLVSRVEVVTGGASAAYGSDAVAGVVNFILDKKFQGLKVSGSLGITERGDGHEHRISATAGQSLLDDRLHIVASGEYYRNEGITGDARDFRRQGANLIRNPAVTTANPASATNPALIVANEARINSTYGGLIVSTSTQGTAAQKAFLLGKQFLSSTSFGPFNFGTLTTTSGTNGQQNGGDGINLAILQPISRPLERASGYVGLRFDVADAVTLYANGSYGWSEGVSTSTPNHSGSLSQARNIINIKFDNGFLRTTPALQPLLDQMGSGTTKVNSFLINRYDSEVQQRVVNTNSAKRVEAGFEARLGRFKLDVSGQYGENIEDSITYNNIDVLKFAAGIDSILSGTTVVCRNLDPACVPINPFGAGSYTPQMIAYFTGTGITTTKVKQKFVQANITGDLFGGIGAGPWGLAVGAEHRVDEVDIQADAVSANNGFFANNQVPWAASRKVTEEFIELNAPLLKDVPLAQLLEVNGAARHTNYSTSGNVTTWKVGLNYKPFEDLRLRGTISRDIRAPGLGELFNLGRSTTANYSDVTKTPAQPLSAILTVAQGNPNLVPEVADTTVIGMVYQPSWMPGLSFSVDRFDVKLKDAITQLSGQALFEQCALGFAQVCGQIIRDASGTVVRVNNSNFNLGQLRLTGYDFEGRLVKPLLGGQLTLRAQVSYLQRNTETDVSGVSVNNAGNTTTPKWRGLGSINYAKGNVGVFLQGRYIGSNVTNVSYTDASAEYYRIPAQVYLDGQLSVDVGKRLTLTFNVQNLLDKQPVFSPIIDPNTFSPVTGNVYDQIGRTFRFGFSARF
jgi:iron complex outermembrane receptor protein